LPAEKAAGVTVDPSILERYVGKYELKSDFFIVVTREGTRRQQARSSTSW